MDSPDSGSAAPEPDPTTSELVPPPAVAAPPDLEALLPLATVLLTTVALFVVDLAAEQLPMRMVAGLAGSAPTSWPAQYYLLFLVYGALAGLCLVASDRALRPVPRAVRWGLGLFVAAALFRPATLALALTFDLLGWALVAQALPAIVGTAVGVGIVGAALGCAAGRTDGRLWRLALVGAGSGAVAHVIERLALTGPHPAVGLRLLTMALTHPNAFVLVAVGAWVLRGATLGLALGVALGLGRVPPPPSAA